MRAHGRIPSAIRGEESEKALRRERMKRVFGRMGPGELGGAERRQSPAVGTTKVEPHWRSALTRSGTGTQLPGFLVQVLLGERAGRQQPPVLGRCLLLAKCVKGGKCARLFPALFCRSLVVIIIATVLGYGFLHMGLFKK